MPNRKFLIIYLLTFMLMLIFLGGCSKGLSQSHPKAKEGILDLARWQLEEGVISLDGEWEFYWNQLLEPRELKEPNSRRDGYINIPSSWNKFKIDDKELFGDGYATYRLLLKTEESGRLGIPRVFASRHHNLQFNSLDLK